MELHTSSITYTSSWWAQAFSHNALAWIGHFSHIIKLLYTLVQVSSRSSFIEQLINSKKLKNASQDSNPRPSAWKQQVKPLGNRCFIFNFTHYSISNLKSIIHLTFRYTIITNTRLVWANYSRTHNSFIIHYNKKKHLKIMTRLLKYIFNNYS